VTTWIALFILAFGAMLLVSNESGMIAGIDATTFGYVAVFSALLVYLLGGTIGRYGGRASSIVRDAVTWLALGPYRDPHPQASRWSLQREGRSERRVNFHDRRYRRLLHRAHA
jgi:hypothetical protein